MGWIKLDRKILDNNIWNGEKFTKGQAWIDLLLLANHKDSKELYRGSLKQFKKGSVYRSKDWLAKRWKWTWRTTDRFLKMLERENMVIVNCTKHDTTISIVNWSFYQGKGRTDDRTESISDDTSDSRTDDRTDDIYTRNNKEIYKKDKEIEEDFRSDEPEEDDGFFESWIINDEGYKEFIDMKQVETEEGFIYFDRAGRKYITDWDKGYRLADE